ncbi:MAG: peptidoglycan-binding protein LysM, partial [Candidatus Heimdallarchaeaceae archaeon]
RYGYVGKYQFGYAARKSCGYGEIKFNDFIKNPTVWSEKDQEAAMITLMSKNESHLRDVIRRYNGKTIKGVTVTKSGILAAAHLAGAGGVKRYFHNGSNPRDAYGTGLEDYLFKFSGFNI